MSRLSKKIKKSVKSVFGGGIDSLFPGVGVIAGKGIEAMMPDMPDIPAAPLSPDNDPAAQAAIAEAAERERERAARRRGRDSTVLAGELNAPVATARRRLLGFDGE